VGGFLNGSLCRASVGNCGGED